MLLLNNPVQPNNYSKHIRYWKTQLINGLPSNLQYIFCTQKSIGLKTLPSPFMKYKKIIFKELWVKYEHRFVHTQENTADHFISFSSLRAARGPHFTPGRATECWCFTQSLSHSGPKKAFPSGRNITTVKTCNLPSHNFLSPFSVESSWPKDGSARNTLTLFCGATKKTYTFQDFSLYVEDMKCSVV